MKRRAIGIITAAILSLLYSEESFSGGSVTVIENKVTIIPPYAEGQKEKIYIRVPEVNGLQDEDVLEKLKETLSLKNVFGMSLDEIRNEVTEGWRLAGIGYTVNYNDHYLLDITFRMDTNAAYPETTTIHEIINLRTGEPVKAENAFKRSMLSRLIVKLRKIKEAEEKQSVEDVHAEQREWILEGIARAKKYSEKDLNNFEVSDKGVTFLYSYDFPHVIRALEPKTKYFISYHDLAPFINPNGPLGYFIKG